MVRKLASRHRIRSRCFRGDDISRPGSITRDIVEAIYKARIIVADLSDNNANVFYELGIAHSIGNKAVMLARDISTLPFDLRSYRVIPYDTLDSRYRRLQQSLSNAMDDVLTGKYDASSPVQDYAPIKHRELISDFSEVLSIETHTEQEIWIIGPNVDIDIQLYAEVIRKNIVDRGIQYKYILPNSNSARNSWSWLKKTLDLPRSSASRLQLRYAKDHEIECEIVLYDPYTNGEKVYLMPPVEETCHFYYRVQGSRAIAIRERFEKIWNLAELPRRGG